VGIEMSIMIPDDGLPNIIAAADRNDPEDVLIRALLVAAIRRAIMLYLTD
jgi:hypothetical protein